MTTLRLLNSITNCVKTGLSKEDSLVTFRHQDSVCCWKRSLWEATSWQRARVEIIKSEIYLFHQAFVTSLRLPCAIPLKLASFWKFLIYRQGYEEKVRGVVGCVFFGSVGRNCIKQQPKGSVVGTIFIPFCTSWVPRGIWKSTKITTGWKHANPNTNKMKNRKFFECVAILLKTGGLNGCTFTVVLWKRGVKKVRLYI